MERGIAYLFYADGKDFMRRLNHLNDEVGLGLIIKSFGKDNSSYSINANLKSISKSLLARMNPEGSLIVLPRSDVIMPYQNLLVLADAYPNFSQQSPFYVWQQQPNHHFKKVDLLQIPDIAI